MPAAEVDITVELVRSLLSQQHPDLADLPIAELANGWDNVIFRLGDHFTVRLPRREIAARLVDHEQAVLPTLAQGLPIPIPAPVRVGRPAIRYPWSWSVNPWIPGHDCCHHTAGRQHDRSAAARQIPGETPRHRSRRLRRSTRLEASSSGTTPRSTSNGPPQLDWGDEMVTRWLELVDTEPWSYAPTWIHGDLHGANMLVENGCISGVIDWGDVCAGDPATDLSIGWSLFDAEDRDVFRAAAGTGEHEVDDATWQRAEAWALHFAVIYTTHSADNPVMAAIGEQLRSTLLN